VALSIFILYRQLGAIENMAYGDSYIHHNSYGHRQVFYFELSRAIYNIKASTIRRLTSRLYEELLAFPRGQGTRQSPYKVDRDITPIYGRRDSQVNQLGTAPLQWILEHLSQCDRNHGFSTHLSDMLEMSLPSSAPLMDHMSPYDVTGIERAPSQIIILTGLLGQRSVLASHILFELIIAFFCSRVQEIICQWPVTMIVGLLAAFDRSGHPIDAPLTTLIREVKQCPDPSILLEISSMLFGSYGSDFPRLGLKTLRKLQSGLQGGIPSHAMLVKNLYNGAGMGSALAGHQPFPRSHHGKKHTMSGDRIDPRILQEIVDYYPQSIKIDTRYLDGSKPNYHRDGRARYCYRDDLESESQWSDDDPMSPYPYPRDNPYLDNVLY
jgi:hypothetical protein